MPVVYANIPWQCLKIHYKYLKSCLRWLCFRTQARLHLLSPLIESVELTWVGKEVLTNDSGSPEESVLCSEPRTTFSWAKKSMKRHLHVHGVYNGYWRCC